MSEVDNPLWSIQCVRACDFHRMIEDGDAGNQEARLFITAFMHWDKKVRESKRKPACFGCYEVVTPENFGGMAFGRSDDQHDGLCGAFCVECVSKGWETLCHEFGEGLAQHFDWETIRKVTLQ